MKQVCCFFLVIIIFFSVLPSVILAQEQEEYISVNVEYSDNIGTIEQLELMIKDNNIYVNAGKLSERFGYKFDVASNFVCIYNTVNEDLPYGKTYFFYEDTKVFQTVFTRLIDTYEAPFSSVKNDMGSWEKFCLTSQNL